MQYLLYISPIVLGLVEVVKRAGLPSKFAPLVGVIFGLGLSFIFFGGYSVEALVQGFVASLTAMGVYSGVKATLK